MTIKQVLKGKNLSNIKNSFYNSIIDGRSISPYNQRLIVSRFVNNDFDFVLSFLSILKGYTHLDSRLLNHTISTIPPNDLHDRLDDLKLFNLDIENYNLILKRFSKFSRRHCVELFDNLAASDNVNNKSYKYVVKSILNQPQNTSLDYVIINRLYRHIDSFDESLTRQLLELFIMAEDTQNSLELYYNHKLLLDNVSVFKLVNFFIKLDKSAALDILNDWLRFNELTPSLHLLELKLTNSTVHSRNNPQYYQHAYDAFLLLLLRAIQTQFSLRFGP
ncbi:hypothetical protein E3Q17_04020 [Wallemia mellicola]|uniref:Uncharacterized protein n=1 Tax=Wallemia mellicola TaxID=1708541 RepID=A0A4T0PYI7_9BASI|nr:hypothetical protein E3Q24_04276 [Wallemia mellicola]TIB83084.1 hypothetical protein E3Q21_03106 [Wallemia mellicola]TIB85833.1 hypothetical protein E3Q20_03097 [Wallemia mellicola]TIB96081.1 hypothetical protein E3Q17_04020 [Wallemia mellicola]TIC15819.1 hypothetical protein E3Q13_03240 [Wallemia mellicola]